MTELDPALNKGPWSDEETGLFWERLHESHGDCFKVAEGLPGRNRFSCYSKFRSVVRYDKESMLYGGAIEKKSRKMGLVGEQE
jgi:hypothetical protein